MGTSYLIIFSGILWSLGALARHVDGKQVPDALSSFERVEATESQEAFFEKKIRPLLIKHCLECHSTETESSGGLVLDSKAGWVRGGDSGPAILPGNAEESLLIHAVAYDQPRLKMPPDGRLPESELDSLKHWIQAGAYDPRIATSDMPSKARTSLSFDDSFSHWSYRPIARISPAMQSASAVSFIDVWVDQGMREQGLKPTERAAPAVLIRRLSLDLTGLPPTEEAFKRFIEDPSPQSYRREVESILATRAFAERFARHWLDVARYAESLTLRGLVLSNAWRYRDYCIDAMNEDLPMNRFLQEQIAGDLMSYSALADRRRGQIATTFLLLGNHNLEEQDKKQLDMDIADEQLDTFGKAMLGQTLGCARCHDHKFDPISMRDYYAMAGILRQSDMLEHANVSKWIDKDLPEDPFMEKQFLEWESNLSHAKEELRQLQDDDKGSRIVDVSSLPGIVLDDSQAKRVGEWTESNSVKSYVGSGYLHDGNSGQGNKTVTFEPEVLKAGKYEIRLSHAPGDNRATHASVRIFSADGEQVFDWNQRKPGPIGQLWTSFGTFRFEEGGQAYVIVSNSDADGHVIVDAIQFLPVGEDPPNPGVEPAEMPDPSEDRDVRKKELQGRIKRLESELKRRSKSMGLKPNGLEAPLKIHIRGSVHNLGEEVPWGPLRLASMDDRWNDPNSDRIWDRRRLAEWLTDAQNPLPARVFANRVWLWVMGKGLVSTPDNFGTTGTPPSHPELLDSLAIFLQEHDWSIKSLVREIVLSDAYQRAGCGLEDERVAIDPSNQWYSRFDPRRLDAETIRDTLLWLSGSLEKSSIGPGFPSNLESDYRFQSDERCRSIYLPVFRNSLPEWLVAFDFADPSVTTGARNCTTVAQQSLLMLNSNWLQERSKEIVNSLVHESEAGVGGASSEGAKHEQFLNNAGLRIWGRPLDGKERDRLLQFLTDDSNGSLEERQVEIIRSLVAALPFRYEE